MNKNEAIVANVMLFVLGAITCVGIIFSTDTVQPQKSEQETTQISNDWECDSTIRHDWECDSTISHDWECKYIIKDCYTQEGGCIVHYIDEVVKNVDGSITFVGDDGLKTTIPYPYYTIEENPSK